MKQDRIIMAHGSGGKLSHQLIDEIFVPEFKNPELLQLNDAAVMDITGQQIAMSTDTFVVNPPFFPGGNIGKLAVCGTVNDIAMSGAKPLYLSAGFIIEEGFEIHLLEDIVKLMSKTAKEAGVSIVTGDTKVVEKGSVDKIYINTAGVGVFDKDVKIGGAMAKPGDVVLINGTIGDHGIAIMAKREGIYFEAEIESDCAPLNGLIEDILHVSDTVRVLRDPTRGGVATTLNEIAEQSGVGIELNQESLPIKDSVEGVCEILGFDPLYVANEGKVLVIVDESDADKVLSVMKQHKYGKDSTIIGKVTDEHAGKVFLNTVIGGRRMVDMLAGDMLPRIC